MSAGLRLLVCGSRDLSYRHPAVWWRLDETLRRLPEDARLHIITGGAPGADRAAEEWLLWRPSLRLNGRVSVEVHRADWGKYGKAAGPLRNQRMLDEGKPDRVLAFVNKPLAQSRGTADMVRRARQAGLPVDVVEVQS